MNEAHELGKEGETLAKNYLSQKILPYCTPTGDGKKPK